MVSKARPIMIQGTASSVGKSLLCAGLCRIFKQDGYRVAPFKSQNMALNSFITREGKEMGRAQVVQAEAAGIEPDVRMNPVLLKPTTDKKAQVILQGEVYKNMSAVEYHEFKPELRQRIQDTYRSLAQDRDIIVIEGAGSPAEINLRDRDLVNMGMAEMADSPVLLVGDIDKGGVFASLAGTMLLLTEEEKRRVKGVIINKFRGDLEILKPGIQMLEELIQLPVLGVIPYTRLNIDEEDSVTERFHRNVQGNQGELDIAIIKPPHISNFTDFNALENIEGVTVRYVDEAPRLHHPDLIILPGSKNTVEDLLFLRKTGMEDAVKRCHQQGAILFGICGGYQMLGAKIEDPSKAETEHGAVTGMGYLNMHTVFQERKTTTQVKGTILGNPGMLAGLEGTQMEGYEIHMGTSMQGEGCIPFLMVQEVLGQKKEAVGGVVNTEGTVFGTYLHGIFDNMEFTYGLINNLRAKKDLSPLAPPYAHYKEVKEQQYDQLAELLRNHLDISRIYEIIHGEGV